MTDKPPTPFPTEQQVTSFMARGVSLARVSSVPVHRAPELVIYHEGPQPPAALPDNVKRARTIEEGPEPETSAPSSSVPPTEAQLRELLVECNASHMFACENRARAEATHARAQRHMARTREALAAYDELDQQIATATIEALQDEHRPRVDVPDELRRKLTERDRARDDVAASERALKVLTEELADCRQDAERAARAAEQAAAALSMVLAERMAERVLVMETEIVQLRETVLAADVVGVAAPTAMRTIQGDGSRYRRVIDKSAWVALRARLHADPAAALTLDPIGEHE